MRRTSAADKTSASVGTKLTSDGIDNDRREEPNLALRKLYDPLKIRVERVGNTVGVVLVIIYLLAWLIGGSVVQGGTFLLAVIFGILAIVLTPTVIGLYVMYVIALACGINLLGAYFGVLIVGLVGWVIYYLGVGIGRGVTRMIGR